jgi:hypothetical protein
MSSDPATSEAGARPLEGQLSLQINEWLVAISFEKKALSCLVLVGMYKLFVLKKEIWKLKANSFM